MQSLPPYLVVALLLERVWPVGPAADLDVHDVGPLALLGQVLQHDVLSLTTAHAELVHAEEPGQGKYGIRTQR